MSFEPVMPPYNASDPSANFLGSSCLDFLLIELVPLARRVAHERDAIPAAATDPAVGDTSGGGAPAAASSGSVVAGSVADSTPRRMDEDEEMAAVHYRLDAQGYRVGQGLVERYVCIVLCCGMLCEETLTAR